MTYALRQKSYFRVEEYNWLKARVEEDDVKPLALDGKYTTARAILATAFRAQFTGPAPGETTKAFNKRRANTRKNRKGLVTQIRAETPQEWEERMRLLNDVRLFLPDI